MRVEKQYTSAGYRVQYFIVIDDNNHIVLITKNSQIARSMLK
jgi:hypothetical protein